jgi:hypothetical protein
MDGHDNPISVNALLALRYATFPALVVSVGSATHAPALAASLGKETLAIARVGAYTPRSFTELHGNRRDPVTGASP